ncbi:hypothetical protein ASG67_10465 [Sphingomonas sp. Leaf339]|uniref:hypothetical protein n=1 Tax=Sphingomonas sp. Leaf339 TaxID=1736343 RepID=UPI0006FFA832|nr:hypothetical protein [Sphingomonas sp. Leaf339]KQU53222.1 hypothetical protein ASG67_10465 [Sphingomonas sp. Leaf339]
MNNRFAILDASRVLQSYFSTSDQTQLAANIPPGGSSIRTDDVSEPGTVKYDTAGNRVAISLSAPVETAEQALARMIGVIDGERETRMMTDLTDGGAKKYEYAEKAREVRDYRSLGGAVVASLLIPLNINGTRDRFGWSMAEADDTGDTLETVIARYEAKIIAATLPRKVAARAQKLKRQLRAAAPTARAAIFNARTWPS